MITDLKAGAAVATTTMGTGMATVLEYIPDDIGKLASLLGVVATGLLIWVHLLNARKIRKEIKRLEDNQPPVD